MGGFKAPGLSAPWVSAGVGTAVGPNADGAVGFSLDAGKAQLAAVTYKIVRRL